MLATMANMFNGPLPVKLRKANVDSLSEMPQISAVRAQSAMRVKTPSMSAPCKYHTPKLATPLAPSMRWTVLIEMPMAASKSTAFFNSRKGGLALHRFGSSVSIEPRADVHEGGSRGENTGRPRRNLLQKKQPLLSQRLAWKLLNKWFLIASVPCMP